MYKRTIILILASLIWGQSKSQSHKPVFVALQPGITKEKFYEEDELDVNIVPLVVQTGLNRRVDLRFVSTVNYHFGGVSEGLSDVGFQTLVPIYFKKKEELYSRAHGFYMAPLLGLGRNLINDHYTAILGAELGYHFKADKRFTLTIGTQYGRTFFAYDDRPNVWREHFGLANVNLGIWLF